MIPTNESMGLIHPSDFQVWLVTLVRQSISIEIKLEGELTMKPTHILNFKFHWRWVLKLQLKRKKEGIRLDDKGTTRLIGKKDLLDQQPAPPPPNRKPSKFIKRYRNLEIFKFYCEDLIKRKKERVVHHLRI